MSLPNWWIEPAISQSNLQLFALILVGLTAVATVFSPHRRRQLGVFRFALAHASLIGVPLAAVIVLRGGYRAAYLAEGRSWFEAILMSGLWTIAAIVVGGLLVRTLPPTAWLIRDLRAAGRDMWKGRVKRAFGFGS